MDFIEKAKPLGKISQHMLLRSYMKGLKEDIRRQLRVLAPQTLKKVTLTIRIDEKLYFDGSMKVGQYRNQTGRKNTQTLL